MKAAPVTIVIAFLLVAASFCDACAKPAQPHPLDRPQLVDPDTLVRLPLPALAFDTPVPADAPRRIVSMIPSATELLFALGLGDRLVGRSDWCDWPPEAESRPALGNQQSMSVERVADLRPDLVIFWAHLPDKKNRLVELFKLHVVTPGTEGRDEVFDGIRMVADACRVPERGRSLVAFLEAGLSRVRSRYEAAPRTRTLVVLDRNQVYYVPGKESFVQQLFDLCGLENVAFGLDAGKWPAASIEQVLDWNPDVILDLSLGVASSASQVAAARAFWKTHDRLDAVRSGRVVVLNAGVLVRPGPRLVAVADELGRIVHATR